MASTEPSIRSSEVGPSEPPRRSHLGRSVRRRLLTTESKLACGLGALALLNLLLVVWFPSRTPFSSLVLPLVIGSLLLSPRTLPWFVGFLTVLLTVAVTQQTLTTRTVGAVVVLYLVCLVILLAGLRRARLGVAGLQGESMFVDLRDRILGQGGMPDLPPGWLAESAVGAAGGTPFSGDFVVTTLSNDGRLLQVALVDVSGKGVDAGTRALLLSGSFGALLGAVPPSYFLAAANDYLLRQDWDEGFATAVHLVVDLHTGDAEVRTAGHPPAVRRPAGGGEWERLATEGPLLGLVPEAAFVPARAHLEPGEAVLLYTDGLIEDGGRDIDLGLADLVTAAERLLAGAPSAAGSARRLVRTVGSRGDDRAVLVVQRLA